MVAANHCFEIQNDHNIVLGIITFQEWHVLQNLFVSFFVWHVSQNLFVFFVSGKVMLLHNIYFLMAKQTIYNFWTLNTRFDAIVPANHCFEIKNNHTIVLEQ